MNPIHNGLVTAIQLLPKSLVKRFAMRYIAGDSLDDAIRVVKMLNTKDMMATLDILGENVTSRNEALAAARTCDTVLQTVRDHRLNANLSLKLTQLGLRIDEEFCYANLKKLLEIAEGYHNFVRIDMEDSGTTPATLTLYQRLRSEGIENAGVVIQAYLRRSEDDVKHLLPLKANVRLCKGAYIEPASIAFKDRDEIRMSYLNLLNMLLQAGCYVGLATHDEALVQAAIQAIRKNHLEKSRYEFQMLYGVKVALRQRIVEEGHRLRVYVPFGEEWHAYSIRRFKENPRLAWTVFRAFVSQR